MKAQRELLEKKLDLIVLSYETQSRMLGLIRGNPDFLRNFTAGEIRAINLLDRSISVKIGIIQAIKESDLVKRIRNYEEFNSAWEKGRQLELEMEALNPLIDVIRFVIPQHRTPFWYWILFPWDFVSHRSFMLWQKIINFKLRIEERMVVSRRKKMIEKKLSLEVELSQEEEDFYERTSKG